MHDVRPPLFYMSVCTSVCLCVCVCVCNIVMCVVRSTDSSQDHSFQTERTTVSSCTTTVSKVFTKCMHLKVACFSSLSFLFFSLSVFIGTFLSLSLLSSGVCVRA
eukprot:TRINITY_DN64220_c0_g1_i11.p2 TRINITY_DN64220_c0_g1~~TRINITY_DN64220_c0_g1_i11.p2  ORF type:complete len:105 (+),score=18.89 TRINITY_DN64220_c0_g1_i11:187-501(+)